MKPARKAFEKFPKEVQLKIRAALTVAAEGTMADTAKPLTGFGGGVFEVALEWRTDAWRTIYAVQLGTDIWVVHAFQKKGKKGRQTPRKDIDVTRERLKRLKKELLQ